MILGLIVCAVIVAAAFALVWAIELAPNEFQVWPETGAELRHVRLVGLNPPPVDWARDAGYEWLRSA